MCPEAKGVTTKIGKLSIIAAGFISMGDFYPHMLT